MHLRIGDPNMEAVLGQTWVHPSQPIVMATGGTAFLLASPLCVSHPSLSLPVALLGSSVYVFMKAAKYSLFKPSEEMVYIDLDERSAQALRCNGVLHGPCCRGPWGETVGDAEFGLEACLVRVLVRVFSEGV